MMNKIVTYTVKYRRSRGLFWRKLKNIIDDDMGEATGKRGFTTSEGDRFEFVATNYDFFYSSERGAVMEGKAKNATHDQMTGRRSEY
jgi:hypothetical protein